MTSSPCRCQRLLSVRMSVLLCPGVFETNLSILKETSKKQKNQSTFRSSWWVFSLLALGDLFLALLHSLYSSSALDRRHCGVKVCAQKTVLIIQRSTGTEWQRGGLYLVRALPAVTRRSILSLHFSFLLSFLIEGAELWAKRLLQSNSNVARCSQLGLIKLQDNSKTLFCSLALLEGKWLVLIAGVQEPFFFFVMRGKAGR